MSHIYAVYSTQEVRDRVWKGANLLKGYPSCRVQSCPKYDTNQSPLTRRGVLVTNVCQKDNEGNPVNCTYATVQVAARMDSSAGRFGIELTPEFRQLEGETVNVDGIPTTIDWSEEYNPPHVAPGEPTPDETWSEV